MRDEIRTDRLVLRPLRASDAECLFAYRGDPEVARFQSWEPQSLDEMHALIAAEQGRGSDEPGWSQLAIAEAATGVLLGAAPGSPATDGCSPASRSRCRR